MLVLVNDVLADKDNIRYFEEVETEENEDGKSLSAWEPFLNLLNRTDVFIVNMSSLILAKV